MFQQKKTRGLKEGNEDVKSELLFCVSSKAMIKGIEHWTLERSELKRKLEPEYTKGIIIIPSF